MKKMLLNALLVFVLMLVASASSTAQTVYTMCAIPGNSTTDSTGILYDSGGPLGQYQNSEDCTLLVAPPCATSITLYFDSFATESGFDYLYVYDGQTGAAPQVLVANGQTVPSPVTCTSGYMLLVWHSDISIVYDGFRCHWNSIIAPSVAPNAAFSVSDLTPPLNTNIQFTDNSIGGPTTWLYDFGDGDTSRRQNPLHAFTNPGTYNVMFVAFSCTESDTAYITVNVQAAPQIDVVQDSFVVSAQCGDSTTYPMDVTNIAGGELFWTSDADVNTGLPIRMVVLTPGVNTFLTLPNTIQAIDTFVSNYTLQVINQQNPGYIANQLFGKNVLLIPEQEVTNVQLATFWTNMAPVIQNFMNNGGSVIWCGSNGALADAMFNAGVFTGSFANDAVFDNLTVVNASHPLAQGVAPSFTAPSATYAMNLTNANKETIIADQGTDIVSWLPYGSGKAIFLAFNYYEDDQALNASRCIANAVQWGGLNGLPSWITLSQDNDTVNASDTTHVLVTFQTTGLPAGTYIAAIPVASNDPAQPVILLPCTLTITGFPIIALSDTCVDFGTVMQYRNELRQFDIVNNGCDTLFVTSLSSNAPEFIVSSPFSYLLPGQSGSVNVSFLGNTVGTFSGTLSVRNNDVDTTLCLSATTFAAPDVNTSTNSLSITIPACGATGTQTFDVENLGGTDLIYGIANLPTWLTATTTGDTVTAGGSQTVTLTFNSGTLVGGNYTANVAVVSNDPRTPSVTVAVTFTVGQNPCMNYTFASNTCTGETNFTSTAINTPSSYSWDFGDGSVATTANPTHYYGLNGNYTVTLIACNAAGCDTVIQSVQAIITGPQPTNCYPVTTAYCCGIGLTNVSLGTINKNTNDAIEGYQNYTCTDTTSLEIGQSYAFAAQTGFVYNESVLAWIDWNNDTQLDPVTEQVYSDNNVLTFHNGTITVPGNAVVNQPLRFRVASDYSANPTPAPCLDLQFGQVEDYSIFVRLPVKVDEIALNIPFSVYPNPFANNTRIEYQLTNSGTVTMEVFNLVGEKVQSLASMEKQVAGKHTFYFEGTQPGIYTVRLTVDGQSVVKKIVKL